MSAFKSNKLYPKSLMSKISANCCFENKPDLFILTLSGPHNILA